MSSSPSFCGYPYHTQWHRIHHISQPISCLSASNSFLSLVCPLLYHLQGTALVFIQAEGCFGSLHSSLSRKGVVIECEGARILTLCYCLFPKAVNDTTHVQAGFTPFNFLPNMPQFSRQCSALKHVLRNLAIVVLIEWQAFSSPNECSSVQVAYTRFSSFNERRCF